MTRQKLKDIFTNDRDRVRVASYVEDRKKTLEKSVTSISIDSDNRAHLAGQLYALRDLFEQLVDD